MVQMIQDTAVKLPLTTRGRWRNGAYYWEVIAQGKKVGGWGFGRFPYCNWRLVPYPVLTHDGQIEVPNFW